MMPLRAPVTTPALSLSKGVWLHHAMLRLAQHWVACSDFATDSVDGQRGRPSQAEQ